MKKWTKKEKERVKVLFLEEGKSRGDIAEEFKTSYDSVSCLITRNKWKKPRETKPKSLTEEFVRKAKRKEIRQLLARNTMYDVIGESLISATEAIPEGVIPSIEKITNEKPEDEEEICTLFSDSHIGEIVDARESGGLGSYDMETFQEEMEFFRLSQSKIFRIVRNNTPYNVHNIFMLGDIIENKIMRESQLRLTEGALIDQVMLAVDKIAIWLAWLAQQFNQINVFCVVGNHGRMTQKIGVLGPRDSFDYLIYKWVAERLRNYKNISFNISDSWWMGIERMGVKFYIEHGEEFRSWMSIPFYSLLRGKANVRELLRQYLDEKGRNVDFDYFIVGHTHAPAAFRGIVVNGAFTGGDEFSLKKLKAGDPATQTMFSIHPIFKKTWSRDILLQHPDERPKIKFYKGGDSKWIKK